MAVCPSCDQGKNPRGADCIACRGTGTSDLSDVPKSEASVNRFFTNESAPILGCGPMSVEIVGVVQSLFLPHLRHA